MRNSIWLLVAILVVGLADWTKSAVGQEPTKPVTGQEPTKPATGQESTKTLESTETDANGPKAGDRMVKTVKGVEFAFRWCPPGKFLMGSPKSEKDRQEKEEIQHEVTLTKGFWMLETEVTEAMYKSVVGYNSSYISLEHESPENNYPATNVNWDDCQEFCRKLSYRIKMKVSLPTEAQWEYACRAGSTGPYAGDSLDAMGWFDGNSVFIRKTALHNYKDPHPVAQKQPNAWNLYDMHGNVSEWCQDWYGNYSKGSVTDPTGPETGNFRVNRGGGWSDDSGFCRSAHRSGAPVAYKGRCLGFRVIAIPDTRYTSEPETTGPLPLPWSQTNSDKQDTGEPGKPGEPSEPETSNPPDDNGNPWRWDSWWGKH